MNGSLSTARERLQQAACHEFNVFIPMAYDGRRHAAWYGCARQPAEFAGIALRFCLAVVRWAAACGSACERHVGVFNVAPNLTIQIGEYSCVSKAPVLTSPPTI